MLIRNESILSRRVPKSAPAKLPKKRIKRDALIYSVSSNDAYDVASYNKARILKIHRGIISFLSNIELPKGKYVYLGLNIKGIDAVFNSNEFHLVLIKRRVDSHYPSYRFQYQARHINSKGSAGKFIKRIKHEKQILKSGNLHAANDPRSHARKSCRKSIFFHSRDKNYRGIMTNLSRNGAFIETKDNLVFGQTVEIAIPLRNADEDYKLLGKVVRLAQNGVGLNLTKIIGTGSDRKRRISTSLEKSPTYRIPDLREHNVGKHFHNSMKNRSQWDY